MSITLERRVLFQFFMLRAWGSLSRCLDGYGGAEELSGADWMVEAPLRLVGCVKQML